MKSGRFHEIRQISCGFHEIRRISKDQLPGMVRPMFWYCPQLDLNYHRNKLLRGHDPDDPHPFAYATTRQF